ncbi:MAG: sigma-70 family RNA polymerase sigma factor [Bacteroidota bacterium]|nr:sigma-70 family RNA polymerase sigma factor [Bacteroidota bacterium]
MTKEDFKYLFETYFDSVRSYLYYRGANTDDASDIAQEVFMRLWEKQFVVDQKTIKPLLYKIAGDMFVSKYRREVLEMKYIASHKLQDDESSTEEDLSHEELQDKYQKALNSLNEKQRTVFLMSRVEELKYKEIAERLGLSVKAVEKRMSAALQFFKQSLL